VSEGWARLTGTEPRVSVDGVRMSAKRMYFSSAKAVRELGYRSRPPEEAISAALGWFHEHKYL
jgi:dihydroflavonol-4-reductase